MAISDRNILITPNVSATGPAQPNIVFTGADSSIGDSAAITLTARPENSGTLSFTGNAGQLFSITNDLSGTLFAVSDISGIPSLEINENGIVKLAEYSGRVLVGTDSDDSSSLLQIAGNVRATAYYGDGSNLTGISGGDADTLDGLDNTSFLRSDAADTKTSGDLSFSDNVKAIFGDGNDLEIYSDGVYGVIKGTIRTYIDGGTQGVIIYDLGSFKTSATFTPSSSVTLYYNDAARITTSSAGASVVGTMTATSFSGDGSSLTGVATAGFAIAMAIAL